MLTAVLVISLVAILAVLWVLVAGEPVERRYAHAISLLITLLGTFSGVYIAAQVTEHYKQANDREVLTGLIRQAHDESKQQSCNLLRSVRRYRDPDDARPAGLPRPKDVQRPVAIDVLLRSEYFARYFYGKTPSLHTVTHSMEVSYSQMRTRRYGDRDALGRYLVSYARDLVQLELLLELMTQYLQGEITLSKLQERASTDDLRIQSREIRNEVLTNQSSRRCDQRG